jgi:hypothetical protein
VIEPSKLLAKLPPGLREPLIETYREIASNFAEHRWGPSELDGGKLCECVYWIIEGALDIRRCSIEAAQHAHRVLHHRIWAEVVPSCR